jgi:site-specific DNA recombinase
VSPESKPTKPVAIYVRVSRVAGREGDSYISPEEQEERCRGYLRAHGLAAGDVYTDEDRSGRTMDRPGFERAMEDVKNGRAGGIVVARLNRLARNTVATIRTVQTIEEHGGAFLSVDPPVDTTTPSGRFMLQVFAALAELESETIKANWSTAQAYARARGIRIAPRVAFGFERSESGPLVPNEDAELVRTVYRMRGRGATFQACADYMNEQGATTPVLGDGSGRTGGGNPWAEGAVRKLVQNPLYAEGDPALPEEFSAPLRLVPRTLWRKAQPKSDGRRLRKEQHLLSGLVRCGSCGGTMTASTNRKTLKGGEYAASHYVCRQRAATAKPCPKPITVSGALLEPHVLGLLFPDGAMFTGTLTHDSGDAKELLAELAEAEGELREVEALRGKVSPSAYAVALSDAEAAVAAARAAVDEFGAESRVVEVPAEVERENFERLPVEQRREIIAAKIGPVTVAPRKSRTQPIAERVTMVARA